MLYKTDHPFRAHAIKKIKIAFQFIVMRRKTAKARVEPIQVQGNSDCRNNQDLKWGTKMKENSL